MKIVVADDYPVLFGSPDHPELAPLKGRCEVSVHSTRWQDRDELFGRIRDAEVVVNVRAYTKLDAEAIAKAPRLRLINVVGTGTDNVDLVAAGERGIIVSNTPGVASEAVAELALGLVLAVARSIASSDRELRSGTWRHRLNMELRGKTLGLLGLGSIGRKMAVLGAGMGMPVIAWNRTPGREAGVPVAVEMVDLDDLFQRADVVSIHLRSTPETAGLVDARRLALMKPTAILVNTARAVIVDVPALAAALREGRLAGAGLDVHPVEPLPVEQNLFRDLDTAVLTPHSGSISPEADRRSVEATVANIIGFLDGTPQNVVNPVRSAS